ncbi:MAG: FAD-dependent oxidoreductase [Acidimicrobiales bacterium]|nr:FAD-dependent oxidoreductase [Acidimicrobiales bacterium]
MARPHVVIVGAGFGGLAAAAGLHGADVDVTLVDRHNFHTFQPLLYQVATAGLNAADVAYPVRGIFQKQANLRFRQATVTGIDWDRRRLAVCHDEHPVTDLDFDHIVVAVGATTNTFGIPGVEEHGFPLYNLADATRLRNHVLERFEAADADPTLVDDGALTFVVVGGGPTGVETAGALVELFAMVLRRDFPALDISRARVVLVEMLDHLLSPFSPSSQRHAMETLIERGVEVRLGAQVDSVGPTRVRLADGEVLAAHTLVWAAGVQPNPVVQVLDVPTGARGRIAVGRDLRIVDRADAYAIGDVAAIADPKRDHDAVLPQLAPVAIQSGHHAARQIRRTLAGAGTKPFRYIDKGTMATIGRSRAVAELPLGIKLRGTPAWYAWLGLHLVLLAGFRNRLSVFLNWAWNYLTWDRGPRLILRADRPCEDDIE